MAGAVGVAQSQEPRDKDKLPDKGDSVIVKGCLKGLVLQATETTTSDSTGILTEPLSYQLKGNKDLLKKMREKHDGHLVEVSGILKSSLQGLQVRGKQMGKTRVYIGGGPMPSAPSVVTVPLMFSTPSFSISRFAAKLLLTVIIKSQS